MVLQGALHLKIEIVATGSPCGFPQLWTRETAERETGAGSRLGWSGPRAGPGGFRRRFHSCGIWPARATRTLSFTKKPASRGPAAMTTCLSIRCRFRPLGRGTPCALLWVVEKSFLSSPQATRRGARKHSGISSEDLGVARKSVLVSVVYCWTETRRALDLRCP